jgi:hypothetical protein
MRHKQKYRTHGEGNKTTMELEDNERDYIRRRR